MWVDIQDIITYATFGDDRLRGLGVARVEFPISPLTCVVFLTTLSHYRASACVILEDTETFQVLFIVSLFCASNITIVEINTGVHLLKS